MEEDTTYSRDYFAQAALTGLLAKHDDSLENIRYYAEKAYEFADAMLAERDKK